MTSSVPDNGAAILTQGLTKRYGILLAVDSLDLRVEKGEVFGFIGPNGAGKSTTMRMLLGLVAPSSGSATILGLDSVRNTEEILGRTGALIENPTFYPFLSGRDNLRVSARLAGVPDSRVEDVLRIVEMTPSAHRKFKQYSLGMKQRLAVASALLTEPDLLILDEPANGLDPAGIVDMRSLMVRLKGEGKTVFISSHVLHEVEQICDRIAILDRGRVLVQGNVNALLQSENRIEVKVAEPERATTVLRQLDWVGPIHREGPSLLIQVAADRSWEINKALADAAVYASEIKVREESLEKYFLGVTQGQAQETAPETTTTAGETAPQGVQA